MSAAKPRPNHKAYLAVLRRMTPEQRLAKAFELAEFSTALFRRGLTRRFPNATPEELERLLHERIDRCHNQIF